MPDRRSHEQYHRRELGIALDAKHPDHILPPRLPESAQVLDIGCGAGQTLIAAYPDRTSFGLDIDIDALRLGKTWTTRVRFACGRAEALPYREERFDYVVARVSLAYTNISAALSEVRRVLKKGGYLWMTLHPFSLCWQQLKCSNWKGKIYFVYIVLNSLLFHLCQRQFPFLGRYESFQTPTGITRSLAHNGFETISITRPRGKHFLVTARRTSD